MARSVVDGDDNTYGLKWQDFHKKAFYTRPTWLDKVPPFDTNVRRIPASRNPYEADKGDAYDYQHMYLRKCQSLLCAVDKHIRPDQAIILLRALANTVDRAPQDLTTPLKLLCLPAAGQATLHEGIELVVAYCPQVAFEYGCQFCVQPCDWSKFLSALLSTTNETGAGIRGDISVGPLQANKGVVYEQILEHLTGHYDPDAFLHLLPPEGNLLYFLPYIEKAFCRHRAKALQHGIAQFMQDVETEQI
jgi:hypothetical protein